MFRVSAILVKNLRYTKLFLLMCEIDIASSYGLRTSKRPNDTVSACFKKIEGD